MFEFVHKSFMEYFAAEFIAETLARQSKDEIVTELSYELNQEILQFIGGLSAAFANLNYRLSSQLNFSLPSGANTYRKSLASALLYSNQEEGVKIEVVKIDSLSVRRKTLRRSVLASVELLDCSLSQVQLSELDTRGLEFNQCKLASSDLLSVRGEVKFSRSTMDHVGLVRSEARLSKSELTHCRIGQSKCILEGEVLITESEISDSEVRFHSRSSTKNTIIDCSVAASTMGSGDLEELKSSVVRTTQLTITKSKLSNIVFAYPIVDMDVDSIDALQECSGIFISPIVEDGDKHKPNSIALRTTKPHVSPRLAPFLRILRSRNNRILIVNLNNNASEEVLFKLIQFAGSPDPTIVVKSLLDNEDWLPQ